MNNSSSFHSAETLIFIGAGASASLAMPPTNDQAGILYNLCDSEIISEEAITAACFKGKRKEFADFLNLLNYSGSAIHFLTDYQKGLLPSVFPGFKEDKAVARLVSLRRTFDWPVLRHVAKILKGKGEIKGCFPGGKGIPPTYLQDVFDFLDVLLREERGFAVKEKNDEEVFFSPIRLSAGRNLMVHLECLMFACAWQQLVSDEENARKLVPYRAFCDALAQLMGDEAETLSTFSLNHPAYYRFSYAILTTNYEPIFLWLIYQAHRKYNKTNPRRVGNPGKSLQLMLDFPNTLGMRPLADKLEDAEKQLDNDLWYPVTDAVAQRVNDEKHISDRVVRIGKYYFVHGSSNFRHCPKCGRLTLALGDSWDENSKTLFLPGVIKAFSWNAEPRTAKERQAFQNGEYDAIECPFCGQITHTQDNFIHIQTHFKRQSPSFIKEITDEALASLPSVKHVVLLGYSFPTDDIIWTSDFKAMLECNEERKVYCSVICGYDGSDEWRYGEELQEYLERYHHDKNDGQHGIGPIMNAISIFGQDYVRAYTGGIPQVFHNGDKEFIREMLYPSQYPWNDAGFSNDGVVRK